MAEIRYIRGYDLDRSRWDRLMSSAPNADLYGSSAFLDIMTDGWDAVVCGDYEAVLPLPVRKRWGFRYVNTIPFCGPFSVYGPETSDLSLEAMLHAIPRYLVRCDINVWTEVKVPPTGWSSTPRVNHLLDLSEDYLSIRGRYHATCKNILNRGLPGGWYLKSVFPVAAQIQLAGRFGGLGATAHRDTNRFERLCTVWPEMGDTLSLAICDSSGQVHAGGVFLRSTDQLHFLLGWSSPEGRNNNASRHILDHIIRMNAGLPLTLDFEGSDIPGVAQFFESFGAVPLPYQLLRRDKLPAILHQIIKNKNQLFRKI